MISGSTRGRSASDMDRSLAVSRRYLLLCGEGDRPPQRGKFERAGRRPRVTADAEELEQTTSRHRRHCGRSRGCSLRRLTRWPRRCMSSSPTARSAPPSSRCRVLRSQSAGRARRATRPASTPAPSSRSGRMPGCSPASTVSSPTVARAMPAKAGDRLFGGSRGRPAGACDPTRPLAFEHRSTQDAIDLPLFDAPRGRRPSRKRPAAPRVDATAGAIALTDR